ncbi:MAG TPA: glucose-6-phosphate dehydrogenase (coenzyme-F420) [Steroidobacteraceae bacterium]
MIVLRLGYKASAEQFGPNELLDFAVLAEQRGFDSVFFSDHFQPWRHTGGHAPFAIALLAALGARTSRILMGTSVLTPTFRYHPSMIAQAFATLGSMFPQRVILGVGTGESLNEVPALGIRWPEPKERTARLKEALELIRQLWRGERVQFRGEYYRTEHATIYDKPARPPPIYVAAAGPVMASYAGQFADGFICTSGKAPELYRETLLPRVAAGMRTAGRQAQDLDMMIEMKVSFDSSRQRAMEDTRHWAALALSAEEKIAVQDPLEMERLAEQVPTAQAARRWLVSADAQEQVEQLRPYVEMGFRHLVFHAPGPDQPRFLNLYAEQVLPRLRAAFG